MMEAKLVISGEDRTAPIFAEIERKLTAISGVSDQIGRVSGSIARVAPDFDRMSRSVSKFGMNAANMQRLAQSVSSVGTAFGGVAGDVARTSTQVGRLSRALHSVGEVAKSVAPLVAAGVAGAGVKALEAGGDLASQQAKLGALGLPASEAAAVDAETKRIMAKNPNVTLADSTETFRELRASLSHPDEVLPNLEGAVKGRSALKALGLDDRQFGDMIKAGELLGQANNPKDLQRFFDAYVRAVQVNGKLLNPEDLLESAKMSKTAGMHLSPRYLMTTGMSLPAELGGMQAGSAVYQYENTINGSALAHNHAAIKEWMDLGFLTDDDVLMNKQGDIKGLKPGHYIKGWEKGVTDPDKFLYENVIPALDKAGVTDPFKQDAIFARLFPGSRASNYAAHLRNQRKAFENRATQYEESKGIEGTGDLLKSDPTAALGALGTSLQNFGAVLTSPGMKDSASILSSMATSISEWSQALDKWQKEHPDLAKGAAAGVGVGTAAAAGVVATSLYGLLTGKGVPGVVGGAGSLLGKGLVAGAIYEGGKAGIDWAFDKLPHPQYPAGYDPKAEMNRSIFDRASDAWNHPLSGPGFNGSWSDGRFHSAPSGYEHDFTLGSGGGFSSSGRLQPPSNLGYMSKWDSSHVAPTPLGKEGPAIAELKGAADISLTVKIDASPELFSAIETARSISANGALRANTGTSMPEAAPTGVSGN
ncbi:protein of unknown function [Methylocella tundrae]|uniref:Uncharacterized protein n=1 Tax=Methylocella tundrae TaxID=227605 RepID=A0A4U8YX56_METTU|nr:hypothetical protein [Methylocella tundrae]VFU07936.1 protein of unknown function [Methylocella tundrae]